MCFFFRRGRRDVGTALEDAFIMDMLISDESGEDEFDEFDEFDEDGFDEDGENEFDDEFFGPPGPEEPAPARPRGRGCDITLNDLIFWETIFGDDD